MNYLLAATCLVALLSVPKEGAAQDAVRFPPLQADQLTSDQKMGGHHHRAAAQRQIRQSPVSRLCPQPATGNAPDAAVGLSALEYVTAGAAERVRNPHHRPPLDGAIPVDGWRGWRSSRASAAVVGSSARPDAYAQRTG
jgi:hypothetical protein